MAELRKKRRKKLPPKKVRSARSRAGNAARWGHKWRLKDREERTVAIYDRKGREQGTHVKRATRRLVDRRYDQEYRVKMSAALKATRARERAAQGFTEPLYEIARRRHEAILAPGGLLSRLEDKLRKTEKRVDPGRLEAHLSHFRKRFTRRARNHYRASTAKVDEISTKWRLVALKHWFTERTVEEDFWDERPKA